MSKSKTDDLESTHTILELNVSYQERLLLSKEDASELLKIYSKATILKEVVEYDSGHSNRTTTYTRSNSTLSFKTKTISASEFVQLMLNEPLVLENT